MPTKKKDQHYETVGDQKYAMTKGIEIYLEKSD